MIKAELEKKSFYVEDAWRKRDNLTVGVSVDRKELCIKLSDANLAIDQIVKWIDSIRKEEYESRVDDIIKGTKIDVKKLSQSQFTELISGQMKLGWVYFDKVLTELKSKITGE